MCPRRGEPWQNPRRTRSLVLMINTLITLLVLESRCWRILFPLSLSLSLSFSSSSLCEDEFDVEPRLVYVSIFSPFFFSPLHDY